MGSVDVQVLGRFSRGPVTKRMEFNGIHVCRGLLQRFWLLVMTCQMRPCWELYENRALKRPRFEFEAAPPDFLTVKARAFDSTKSLERWVKARHWPASARDLLQTPVLDREHGMFPTGGSKTYCRSRFACRAARVPVTPSVARRNPRRCAPQAIASSQVLRLSHTGWLERLRRRSRPLNMSFLYPDVGQVAL